MILKVTTPALASLWYVQFPVTTVIQFQAFLDRSVSLQLVRPRKCHILFEDPTREVSPFLRPEGLLVGRYMDYDEMSSPCGLDPTTSLSLHREQLTGWAYAVTECGKSRPGGCGAGSNVQGGVAA